MPNNIKNLIWTHIFKYIKYKPKTTRRITTKQIKSAKSTWAGLSNQFEPRLLCKQDTCESRPTAFKRRKLYLLPVSNSEYLFTHSSIYHTLKYKNVPIRHIKKDTSSLLLRIGHSEATMIDNLYYSGIFQEYIGEITHNNILNSRHRCSFDAKLGGTYLNVNSVQYEIDACYESKDKILLVEAKQQNIKSFNIRQLYYPYRAIYDSFGKNERKVIIPIFINKIDNIIHIWQFQFKDIYELTSLNCINYQKILLL